MQFSRFLPLSLIFISVIHQQAYAQPFEIVDGAANVSGQPSSMPGEARKNWEAACEQWKVETKDLNKDNQILLLSCETPACNGTDGTFTCTSTGLVKLKTSGTLATQASVIEPTIVTTPPPTIIVESVPPPRPGYLWVNGYWGWRENRHCWFSGRWEHSRPGYAWVSPRWVAHGHGWHFEGGHWRR